MSAIVESNQVRQLDRQTEPEERVTPEQLEDLPRTSRLLMRILGDIAALKRRWWPDSITHRDRVVDGTGTTLYRFHHGFGGRVNWWPVDWTSASAGAALVRHSDSDDNTLVLVSYAAGTLTLRIEEAG